MTWQPVSQPALHACLSSCTQHCSSPAQLPPPKGRPSSLACAPAGFQQAGSTPRGSGTPSQATKKERERASFYQSLRKKPAAEAGQPLNGLGEGDRSTSLASEASELLDSPAAGSHSAHELGCTENGGAANGASPQVLCPAQPFGRWRCCVPERWGGGGIAGCLTRACDDSALAVLAAELAAWPLLSRKLHCLHHVRPGEPMPGCVHSDDGCCTAGARP